MEIADVRRRLRAALEEARRHAAERRTRVDEASRQYEAFIDRAAVPAFNTVAQALVGEGHRYKVFTPAGAVRLASEFSQDDYLELGLDADADVPAVVLHASRGRGRRGISVDSTPFAGRSLDSLTEDDVIEALLNEIVPFVAR